MLILSCDADLGEPGLNAGVTRIAELGQLPHPRHHGLFLSVENLFRQWNVWLALKFNFLYQCYGSGSEILLVDPDPSYYPEIFGATPTPRKYKCTTRCAYESQLHLRGTSTFRSFRYIYTYEELFTYSTRHSHIYEVPLCIPTRYNYTYLVRYF